MGHPGRHTSIVTPVASGTRAKEPGYLGNLLLPLVVLLCALALYFLSLEFPDQEEVGPAVVPQLWVLFTTALCVALITQAVLRRGDRDPAPGHILRVLLFGGWLVLYLSAISVLGYFLSTFVFLIGAMYFLGYRRPLVAIAVATVWVAFSYLVFARLLYIPLPVGPLLRPLLG